MRYTEARLTAIARLLLDEIDEGTVDFMPNYDGSTQEPRLLPARLPFVLLNGASGIAVGMATEIPSHHLREVAAPPLLLLKNPKAKLEEVLREMPGPDFPGGGQIISSRGDIRDVYASGRGSVKVRAVRVRRAGARPMAAGRDRAAARCIGAARSRRDRGADQSEDSCRQKGAECEQQQMKQLVLSVLDTVRDESGKDAAVRLVFEPRTSKIDRDEFTRTLLAHTSMEGNAPINLVMIGGDGRPRCKPLTEVLLEWIEFRIATVRRRSQHRRRELTTGFTFSKAGNWCCCRSTRWSS